MNGKLFTQDFLSEGIALTEAWGNLKEETFSNFRSEIEKIFLSGFGKGNFNEAATESEIIFPTL
jgi:hypothetical protein